MSTCTPSHTVMTLRLLINTGDTMGDSRYLRTYTVTSNALSWRRGRSPESRVPFFERHGSGWPKVFQMRVKMNDPVEQPRKILVDDMNAIHERLNFMQAVIENLPKDDAKRKKLEAAFHTVSREAAYIETMLSSLEE
jgi:hypothetical protein